ncbi:MAG: carbohydrate ABC transporter permease [Actinomycetota bacterium]|nr:carbohydrate ABC transporter permease [Actinomycetota bacterium]
MSGAAIATVAPRTRRRTAEARRRAFLTTVANHAVAIALTAAFVLPLFFVVTTSLMTQQQALNPHDLIPHPFRWRNYTDIFSEEPILRYGWNTLVYAGLATFGVVLSSVPVAYALSVIKWRGQRAVFLLVISTMMLPSQVTIVPLFLLFKHFGWIGSLKPLIVPAFLGDAFSIFLLRQFFLTIPSELVDAARVDGANEFQIMWHVVVKVAKPAIAAVGLFQFLYCWNDFFGPLIYSLNNDKIWTLSVGLQQFTTIHRGVLWNQQMAASVVFMLPVIILFLIAQKAFIEGITLTGVKG